jgi:peptidoglycan/LPS O-acetylase OafA/YrhL
MKHRPELDGRRGVAILAVLGAHTGVPFVLERRFLRLKDRFRRARTVPVPAMPPAASAATAEPV